MLLKKRLLKRFCSRILPWFILLFLFIVIYFYSKSCFQKSLLFEQQALINSNKTFNYPEDLAKLSEPAKVAPVNLAVAKIADEIVTFYSFFFDLPAINPVAEVAPDKYDKVTYAGALPYTAISFDFDKSTLKFDDVSTAIYFPLDYTWTTANLEMVEAHKDKFDNLKFNSFKGPYDDKRCFDNNCLEVKDNKLFYNNRVVNLPTGIKTKEVQAVSLGIVDKKWLVGFTLKNNDYQGEVFYFDGAKFSKIPNFKTISSSYFGLFGFGGVLDDFLIIYGAYQGQAVRVQGDKLTNLDKFFSYRPMDSGFKPEIIRAKSDKYANWYIYSSTLDNPNFFKLWQDEVGEIVGEASLANDLQISGQLTEFNLLEAVNDKVVILAKTKSGDRESWYTFTDRGFKNDKSGSLITLPVSIGDGDSPVVINQIYRNNLEIDQSGLSLLKFEFSEDNLNWQELSLGNEIDFVSQPTKRYFLRLTFPPRNNKFYSPFVDNILFSYTFQMTIK